MQDENESLKIALRKSIMKQIYRTPLNSICDNFHSTGWIVFKRENLSTLRTLLAEIDGFEIDEILLRWRRLILMNKNYLNKK